MDTEGKTTNAPTAQIVQCSGCFTKAEITLAHPGDRVYLDDILAEMGWKKGKATGNRYCPDCSPTHRN